MSAQIFRVLLFDILGMLRHTPSRKGRKMKIFILCLVLIGPSILDAMLDTVKKTFNEKSLGEHAALFARKEMQ